jgi:fructose-specific PTS system IIA-like component
LPNGIHARPASALEEVARRFESSITLENGRTAQSANAKSVLGIVGLDIRNGDDCRLVVGGSDEQEAAAALAVFLEDAFPRCDDALPGMESPPGAVALPRVLAEAGARVLPGMAVVPGIAEGRAVHVGAFVVPPTIPLAGPADARAELARTEEALDRLVAWLDARIAGAATGIEADLVRAHRSVARDPEFSAHLARAIAERDATAGGAIASAERTFTAMLAATGSALLRERALDIRDVCVQLLRELYGDAVGAQRTVLSEDSVCVADVLTPGQFLALDAERLKGLVLAHGGTTSHTVILARSRGVPTLVGVGQEAAGLHGCRVIVDGDLGLLVAGANQAVERYYALERKRLAGRRGRERFFAERPAATADGRRIEVGANVSSAAEVGAAVRAGAEGIGLFRTEMLFVDRAAAPSEDEQFEVYRAAVAEAGGRPVVIRTLDAGGDKPLAYLKLPREENPFLGYRAVRIYPEFEPLFRAQVRALLRASASGALRVMVPMVSRVEEASWVRRVVEEERAGLAASGLPLDAAMPVGAMIEVPSAAFLVDRLAGLLDFFSIGSNDLLQYFTAVDRSNEKLQRLASPAAPAFVRLLEKIANDAHASGRWVGLCGEMAGDTRYLPLLAGLGLDEISVAPPLVASVKAELSALGSDACRRLVESAAAAATSAEVEALLEGAHAHPGAPMVTAELVAAGDALTKAEAIKEAVDRLFATGRTDRPRELEEAVWNREAAYSTGFGYGFAIPHCRTNAVRTNSIAVLRLRQPVEWGALDGKPVRVVILLALRESGQAREDMAVLATLARRLVHDEFRERLEAEEDPAALCHFLTETIGG